MTPLEQARAAYVEADEAWSAAASAAYAARQRFFQTKTDVLIDGRLVEISPVVSPEEVARLEAVEADLRAVRGAARVELERCV